jgi:polysaccharide export outer membrane protein
MRNILEVSNLGSRVLALLAVFAVSAPLAAQNPATTAAQNGSPAAPTGAKPVSPATVAPGIDVPAEYVVGPGDVLGIVFWRDADMTGDVTVRPDGRITLPIIGEFTALGQSPQQLKDQITKAASKLFVDEPSVTVVVRTINSRKVYITGQVATPGGYPLTGPLTVLQLIALAGGLNEFADKKNIVITTTENGQPRAYMFNYAEVSKGRNLKQNRILKPGDAVVVP